MAAEGAPPEATAYDRLPYPGHPISQAHPSRMAALALLHGLDPAPPDRCRVLELGCGDGGHLLPMAWEFPGSRFTGVDLSVPAVERGRRAAEAVGLPNLDLRAGDVMDLGPDLGTFDYVVAHGLYSWVPPEVADRVLRICRENLSDRGVAYVSYNAFPGGHLRLMVREMLLFHAGGVEDPAERVRQAAGLIRLMATARPEGDPAERLFMGYLENAMGMAGPSLLHDDMAPVNNHLHFREFVARAAGHGLAFLAEAEGHDPAGVRFHPEVVAALRRAAGGDPLVLEQYLDFYRFRRFRQSLLVPAERTFSREVPPDRVRPLFASTELRPAEPPVDLAPGVPARFRMPERGALELRDPLPKAALLALSGAWPRSLSFDEILAGARRILGRSAAEGTEGDAGDLGELLLGAFSGEMVHLHAVRPRVAPAPGERPLVSPVARRRALEDHRVPNLRHDPVHLDDGLSRAMVTLLDGTRDREALLRDLAARAVEGGLAVAGGDPPRDAAAAAARLAPLLEDSLRGLARVGLLVD